MSSFLCLVICLLFGILTNRICVWYSYECASEKNQTSFFYSSEDSPQCQAWVLSTCWCTRKRGQIICIPINLDTIAFSYQKQVSHMQLRKEILQWYISSCSPPLNSGIILINGVAHTSTLLYEYDRKLIKVFLVAVTITNTWHITTSVLWIMQRNDL